ncbi:MAG: hypothetical protein NZO16_07015 [Deltaproteobacteria bacterium]|nr:hypothetical protein [Deltaproteobacteria bacterium]
MSPHLNLERKPKIPRKIPHRVVIVGGGPAGIYSLYQLVQHPKISLKTPSGENPVILFEAKPFLGGRVPLACPIKAVKLIQKPPKNKKVEEVTAGEIGAEQVASWQLSALQSCGIQINPSKCIQRVRVFELRRGSKREEFIELRRCPVNFIYAVEQGCFQKSEGELSSQCPNSYADQISDYWQNGQIKSGYAAYRVSFSEVVLQILENISPTVICEQVRCGCQVTKISTMPDGNFEVYLDSEHCVKAHAIFLAIPPHQLAYIKAPKKIETLFRTLATEIPAKPWPQKISLVVDNYNEATNDPFNESECIVGFNLKGGKRVVVELWKAQDLPNQRALISGVVIIDDETNVNEETLTELIECVEQFLKQFLGNQTAYIQKCTIVNHQEISGLSYNFYPGDQIFFDKIMPILKQLEQERIYLCGDAYNQNFGHVLGAFESADFAIKKYLDSLT